MRKLITLLTFTLAGFGAAAQTQPIQSEVQEVQQGFNAFAYTQKIVAEDPDDFIAFSQTDLSGEPYVFYFIQVSSQDAILAELDPDFAVKDMVLLKDTIYFCGQFAQDMGFIARAQISDLFWNNVFEYDVVPDFASIDKVEAYYRPSDAVLQIAAIGTRYNSTFSYLFHSDEALGWQSEILYDNTATPEILDDLELSTKGVMTVGRKFNLLGTGIIVREYDKDYLMSYFDVMEGYPALYALNKLHMKFTEDEKLAIAGTFINNNTAQTRTLALIADMYSINFVAREYFDGYNNTDIDVRDLAYFPADGKALILETTTSTGYPTNPFDAAIEFDVLNPPSSNVDMYYGVDASGNRIYYSGIVEYQPFQFAAIGVTDANSGQLVVWLGDRSVYGVFDCNKPELEILNQDSLTPWATQNLVQQSIAPINWQPSSTHPHNFPLQIICN
ncbi:MAG: hypothetical protein LBO06_03580 [Bacteroidales bacterium]|jgi:hypothetical protein|nr:hypothetical protein [Bacteroidales bacterium]